MKRLLLLCLLLFATQAAAQDLRPSAYQGKPGVITVRGGKIQGSTGGVTTLATQDITPANSATTSIYVDLSSTPVVSTSTSGFPSSSYFPICVVIKDANGVITSFTDSRPDFFMAGGSSSSSSPAPQMGFYLGNCGSTISPLVQCFNTFANTQQANDCGWTTGSAVVTCSTSHFTAADVGKRAWGYGTCNAFTGNTVISGPFTMATNALSGAIAIFGTAPITILSQAGTTATLSANPLNAVTITANVGGCFIWATPDDTAADAMDAAIQLSSTCAKVFFSAAYYTFTRPHFFTQPVACIQTGIAFGNSGAAAFGNIFYHAGYELEGRGMGNTIWFLTPGFPESGPGCVNGPESDACFVRTLEGRWSDFQITGGQNAFGNSLSAPVGSSKLIRAQGPGSFEHFVCTNWGAGSTNTRGLRMSGWEQLQQVDLSGCGGIGLAVMTGAFATGFKVRVENSPNITLHIEGPGPVGGIYKTFSCYDCGIYGAQFQGAFNSGVIFNNGGSLLLYHTDVQQGGSGVVSALTGYLATTTTGSVLVAKDSNFFFSTGSGTTNNAIKCTVACDVFLENTALSAQSGGKTYQDVAGSRLFDQGANSGFASGGGVSISGGVFNSSSISGVTQTAGNFADGAGLGTSTFGTVSGDSRHGQVTITYAGALTTTPIFTMTFPTAFLVAPSCTLQDVGGNNAFPTQIANGAISTTSVVFNLTFAVAPTAANTDTFVWNCTN